MTDNSLQFRSSHSGLLKLLKGAASLYTLVLARVSDGAYATLALSGELGRARLSPMDRALATELVYGVLKRRIRLDRALAAMAPRGLDGLDATVRDALRLAAHQILFLRVPAHAASSPASSLSCSSARLAAWSSPPRRRMRTGAASPASRASSGGASRRVSSRPLWWLLSPSCRSTSP